MADFRGSRLKLERARERLTSLGEVEKAYQTRKDGFSLEYRYDDATREHILGVQKWADVPDELILLTGEIVQAIRTSLDYAIGDAIERATGTTPSEDVKFEFPIFLEKDDYEKAKRKKLKGLPKEDVDLIDSVQPFTDADPPKQLLWLLHRLNIEDKHRTLHVAGGAILLQGIRHTGAAGAEAFSMETKWFDSPLRFPLQPGMEIVRYKAESALPAEVDIPLKTMLLFAEPAEVHGMEVMALLNRLIEVAEQIVNALAEPPESNPSAV
jgi:hypothetical protein